MAPAMSLKTPSNTRLKPQVMAVVHHRCCTVARCNPILPRLPRTYTFPIALLLPISPQRLSPILVAWIGPLLYRPFY